MPARTDTTKTCTGCARTLPLSAFHKGRRGKCKECRSAEYMRDHDANRAKRRANYAAKREEHNARSRAWYEANREAHREAGRVWNTQHADEVRAYHAAYYRENAAKWAAREVQQRDEIRKAARRRRAANPEQYRRYSRARDARKRGQFIEHVEALVVLERDDGICGICRTDVDPFDFHVDHVIPLARGGAHSYANVQAAHPRCNRRKRDSMPEVA